MALLVKLNEWFASNRILVFAQMFVGSPRGKHCNSPERTTWRKVVSTSETTILVRDHRFFASVLSEMGVGNINTRVAQGFVWTTVKYVVKSSDQLFSMRKGYSEIDIT